MSSSLQLTYHNICTFLFNIYCTYLSITYYNAMVMGMHNYYCMATLVSADFAEIAFKVTGKSNGMNHNRRCFPIEKQGEITSKYILEKYGKSK